jgi:hypothetical protein
LPGNAASTTVCSQFSIWYYFIVIFVHAGFNVSFSYWSTATATPFRLLYRTNGDETLTDTTDIDPNVGGVPSNGNQGFCLSFRNQ